MDLTTVSQHHAVFHDGENVRQMEELVSGTQYEAYGVEFETLPDLGKRLSSFATVNDVHFGETRCGVTEDSTMGPIFSVDEGTTPYPEVMNRAAIEEIELLNPDAILAKGDLTCDGTDEQYFSFMQFYGSAFGDRLYHIRGNHESYNPPGILTDKQIQIDLPGVTLAMIDTVRPGQTGGTVYDDDLEWLAALDHATTNPILVFGHHQIWDPATSYRSKDYFGIQPDESEVFIDLLASKSSIRGYFCGHTHRNRVRRFPQSGNLPWVEVACVKDFPGVWAEYQVFEQGILQINHRVSSAAALAWAEKTRVMYNGTYSKYAFGKLSDRCFVVDQFSS